MSLTALQGRNDKSQITQPTKNIVSIFLVNIKTVFPPKKLLRNFLKKLQVGEGDLAEK